MTHDNDLVSRAEVIKAITNTAVRWGVTGEPAILIATKDAVRALPRSALTTEAGDAPRPLDEWHEDMGDCVWWCWQDGAWLGEPAMIGNPLDSVWPGYHTHFTPHPKMPAPPATEGEA